MQSFHCVNSNKSYNFDNIINVVCKKVMFDKFVFNIIHVIDLLYWDFIEMLLYL